MHLKADMVMADLFQQSAEMPFTDVHFHHDPYSQLQAIIAIHSTALGPALGGCRMLRYANTQDALSDALHLSRAMTYKAAINDLPFGGGKAVILAPEKIHDRSALMKEFGGFVDNLGGRYITAVDSGTVGKRLGSFLKCVLANPGTKYCLNPMRCFYQNGLSAAN